MILFEKLEESVTSRWTKLGAMFNVAPCRRTPDIERLLLDSARVARRNVQVFIMAATWLAQCGACVAKRRLAVLTKEELEQEHLPVLGLLLHWLQRRNPRDHLRFRETIQLCMPAGQPGPLLEGLGKGAAWELMELQASALSRKWGLWIEEFEPKREAMRPLEWIARNNPALAVRALSGGDLTATIAADAAWGKGKFPSEAALARRYGASRSAVREALAKLKLAGLASQWKSGRSREGEVVAS